MRMAEKNSAVRHREAALSEVIGFILLLGLFVAAVSLWMMYVVPVTGREDEITQINGVKDRFTDYKMSLDSLWTNNQTGVTLSTSFDLGTGGGSTQAGGLFLPLLKPIGSSATLSIKNTGDRLIINSSSSGNYTTDMSILEYQSKNNYWIQQRYYYQTGGVFLAQDGGTACRVSPPFTFGRANNGTADIASVTIVPIQVLGGSSIGGTGPVRVDSQMRTPQKIAVMSRNDWVKVTADVGDIATARMWMTLFNETRLRGGITDPAWYTFGVSEDLVTKRGTAYIQVNGPEAAPGSPDVFLTMQRVEYVVTLNNIASDLT